jgi:hypothetical protein
MVQSRLARRKAVALPCRRLCGVQRSSAWLLSGLAAVGGLALLLHLLTRSSEEEGVALQPLAGRSLPPMTAPPELSERRLDPRESEDRSLSAEASRSSALPSGEALQRGFLDGRVVLLEGDRERPVVGARLLLVPGPEEPPPARVAELLLHPQPSHLQSTDEDGRFRFTGLDRDRAYALLAGGAGLVGAQRFWAVQANQSTREYRLHHLYGVHVSLSEGGALPKLHPDLAGQRAGRMLSTRPGVFPLFGAPSSALLAGVPLEELDPRSPARRLHLFSSALEEESLGPFQFRAFFPGYQPLEEEVLARRADLGFSQVELELVRVAEGFGALEVLLIGWRGPCPVFEPGARASAFLRLNAHSELLQYELRDLSGSTVRIEPLPYGEYEATFGTSPQLRSTTRGGGQPSKVRIGPAPAQLVVDLSQRGSLVLHLKAPDGAPWGRAVALLVGTTEPSRASWRQHHFTAPPYRVDDLEPGRVQLAVQTPTGSGATAERPLPVLIPAGGCAELELTLDREPDK